MSFISDTRKQAPSEILKITDDLTAFQFDAAVTQVRLQWENKRDAARFKEQRKAFKNGLRQIIAENFSQNPPEDEDFKPENEID